MSEPSPHDPLEPFFDGALAPAEVAAFKLHLAGCAECAERLGELMYLQSLQHDANEALAAAPEAAAPVVQAAPAGQVIAMRPRRRVLRNVTFAAVSLAAAAALTIYLVQPKGGNGPALALASERHLEARVAYGPADRHRPYGAVRGETSGEAGLLPAIDALVRRGDHLGAGSAWLLASAPERALAELDAAPASPEREVSRAAVRLYQHRPGDALALLDDVIAAHPDLAPALWNRALALRDLDLPLAAAADFRRLVARGEPGWASEAAARASALETPVKEAAARTDGSFAAADAALAARTGDAHVQGAIEVERQLRAALGSR